MKRAGSPTNAPQRTPATPESPGTGFSAMVSPGKFAALFIALGLLLTACANTSTTQTRPTDAEILQNIVGKWTDATSDSSAASGTMTFSSDGSFERKPPDAPAFHGKWRLLGRDTSTIVLSPDGWEPSTRTIRHLSTHELEILPPFASVAPPLKPWKLKR